MAVLVLDTQKNPLMPCSEKRARLLLQRGHAVVARAVPFTIRLKDRIGGYQRTRLDRFGFPRGVLMRQKRVHGFQTGDRVIARVPKGKKAGTYVGRVAIRATGSFNIQTAGAVVQGLSHRHCQTLQRADGYGYAFNPTPKEDARQGA